MEITIDTSGVEKAVNDAVTKQMQKVATDIFAGVVRVSPVDTGRLRAGWNLELGEQECVVENNVEYCGWVMEDGTKHISAKHLITSEVNRVTRK